MNMNVVWINKKACYEFLEYFHWQKEEMEGTNKNGGKYNMKAYRDPETGNLCKPSEAMEIQMRRVLVG